MYLIDSAGRVGTTMLIDWLAQYKKTNKRNDRDRLKHLTRPVPLKNVEKAVYLFTKKPEEQAVSLVKRFGNKQIKKLTGMDLSVHTPKDLKKYNYDVFSFARILMNWWVVQQRPYEIAFVNYDSLWDHLEDLIGFLNLPLYTQGTFPVKRQRNQTKEILEEDQQLSEHLSKVYREYKMILQGIPDFYVGVSNKTAD